MTQYIPRTKAKDEQTVNDSLLVLLETVLMKIWGVKLQWTSHRSAFKPVLVGTNKLTALTDGYLEGDDNKVYALLEAKAAYRYRGKRPQVLWQEAAEMVAWILNDGRGSYPTKIGQEFKGRLHQYVMNRKTTKMEY